MWDTAGQERYRSLIPTYLKNAHCVVFVYDVTKTKSLDNLSDWYKLFAEYQEAPGIVVGNKTDLTAARYPPSDAERSTDWKGRSSAAPTNCTTRKYRRRRGRR